MNEDSIQLCMCRVISITIIATQRMWFTYDTTATRPPTNFIHYIVMRDSCSSSTTRFIIRVRVVFVVILSIIIHL